MQSFASIVEDNEQFQLAKGRRKLDEREQALLNAVYHVAEFELSKLRLSYTRKAAEAKQERERRNFMRIALTLVGPEGRRAAIGFLTRPYIDYFKPPEILEASTSDMPAEAKDAEPTPKSNSAPHSSGKKDQPYRSMVEAFTGWPKAALLFVESSFARMSPLTTAVWFAIVVVGATAFGWAQRTYLVGTYDYFKQRAAQVDVAEEQLREAKTRAENASLEKRSTELELSAANKALEAAKRDRATEQAEWQRRLQELRDDNRKTQELLSKNAGEAVQNKLAALDAKVTAFETAKDEAVKARDEAIAKAEGLARDKELLESKLQEIKRDLETEKQTAKTEKDRADAAQRGATNGRALAAFSNSLIALVSEVFFDKRTREGELWQRRKEFQAKFDQLSSDHASALDSLGVPRNLQ